MLCSRFFKHIYILHIFDVFIFIFWIKTTLNTNNVIQYEINDHQKWRQISTNSFHVPTFLGILVREKKRNNYVLPSQAILDWHIQLIMEIFTKNQSSNLWFQLKFKNSIEKTYGCCVFFPLSVQWMNIIFYYNFTEFFCSVLAKYDHSSFFLFL
jgi:hypothetical protein